MSEDQFPKDPIEEAKKNLYRPGAPGVIRRQNDFHLEEDEEQQAPSTNWQPEIPSGFDKEKAASKVNSFFKRLLVVALVFFVLSLGVATVLYFYGNNTISARNIILEITSPPSVPASDTFSFDVSIQNGNNAELLDAALVIDYPEGTRRVDDNTRPLVSERLQLGTIPEGQIIKRALSARIFGQENSEKEIKVRLEYKVEDSNALFTKNEDFVIALRQAPVSLTIDALREVNSNQEVVLKARINSNSNNVLNDVALNVTYPTGFTYMASNLEVESGQRGQFPLGELKPNESKEVEIRGMISGQNTEEKVFSFIVGTAQKEQPERVTTTLLMLAHETTIRGDFLASNINFSGNPYGTLGSDLNGIISWRNTLQEVLNDVVMKLTISGDLIQDKNITSTNGFYDSQTDTIEWNRNTTNQLSEISVGQSGSFAFNIQLFSYDDALAQRIINPKVELNFDIQAERINENNVPETIRSSFTRTVPIVTSANMTSQTLYRTGPLSNTGPFPPRAEQKTTFTIAISLTNTVNDITDGVVQLRLPHYIQYENEFSPAAEKITWNQRARLLRWDVGTVKARTGYGALPRTLYFKVSITPSRTQIKSTPDLVSDFTFSGKDSFAGATINLRAPDVNTSIADVGSGRDSGMVLE